jgi:hypothetical protein
LIRFVRTHGSHNKEMFPRKVLISVCQRGYFRNGCGVQDVTIWDHCRVSIMVILIPSVLILLNSFTVLAQGAARQEKLALVFPLFLPHIY